MIFNDVQNLVHHNQNVLNEDPMEVYSSALILLPESTCEPLARERHSRSLSTVVHRLPESWLVETSSEFLGFSHCRWLVRSHKTSELVVHEWDPHTNTESQIPLGIRCNGSIKWKVSNDVVIALDMEANTLHFVPLSPSAAHKRWHLHPTFPHPDVTSPCIDISENGALIAAIALGPENPWTKEKPLVVRLVDVESVASQWPVMQVFGPYMSTESVKTIFSPDASSVAFFR